MVNGIQTKTKVGFGVVGCGWVARDYVIPAILESTNAGLVALCDSDSDAFVSPPPEIASTADFEEFLRTPGLDAVYIATPNRSHRPLTEAAARAGKHVICEKPMATSYEDAERMVAACAGNGVEYATAFDQRFQARHVKLKQLIEAGTLGTITSARIHYACWLPADWSERNWRIDREEAGGGAFIDLAPHGIDLLQHLVDEPIVELHTLFQRKVHSYAVDDGAVAIGQFSGGALLQMNVAYNCPESFPRRTLEIIGTRAMALAIDTMGQTPGGQLFLTDAADGMRREITIDPEDDISPFRRQIETFAACLLDGVPFPFSPESDLHTMKLINEEAEEAVDFSRLDSEVYSL